MESVNVSDADLQPQEPQPKQPDSPEVVEVKEDLGNYKALSALVDSEGGKIVFRTLQKDIAADVETIISLYNGDEMALRCAVVKLKVDYNMYRLLRNADPNVKLAEEKLSELLKSE
jgi:hypothetical protein